MRTDECPSCGSDNIDGEGVDVTSAGASQECSCIECGAAWTQYYEPTHHVIDQVPHTPSGILRQIVHRYRKVDELSKESGEAFDVVATNYGLLTLLSNFVHAYTKVEEKGQDPLG